MARKGKISSGVILGFDIIGFVLVILGGVLIRYGHSELITIIGGVVIAAGAAVLGLTKWIK